MLGSNGHRIDSIVVAYQRWYERDRSRPIAQIEYMRSLVIACSGHYPWIFWIERDRGNWITMRTSSDPLVSIAIDGTFARLLFEFSGSL